MNTAIPEPASVESLFARIREDREQAVANARVVLAQADPSESTERPVPDDDEKLLQLRDAAMTPIEAALTRRLKRVLQDDQNDLLDRLRGLRTHPTAAFVLPARSAQTMRFAAASLPMLGEAAAAGADFVTRRLGRTPLGDGALGSLDDVAAELANVIVFPLRRRLEEVFAAAAADDDRVALAESIGAAYREWKTQRIEATGADYVAAAYSRGAYAATPAGTTSRWLVEDVDGPCPDCDDNVLAGAVPKGDAYPTGQPHPPAHSGCRCLAVPNPR
ncbi:MAG: hypothetical protein M3N98_06940 [Actinomycetota bacterium]|nr:hypothetical protein [Actinomycetota bacterium]